MVRKRQRSGGEDEDQATAGSTTSATTATLFPPEIATQLAIPLDYNDDEDTTGGEGDFYVKNTHVSTEVSKQLGTKKERKAATYITPMQEVFIAAYVATRDRNKAALQAGYKPEFAPQMARRLLNQTMYPLVCNKIKECLRQQQQVAVMDGAAVLKYVHTILQFQPAMWFLPGDDGGWLMDMDDVRVLPPEILQIIEHIEMKTINAIDGTVTNKMWVKFISKTQALSIAARYQLGDLNQDATPVVQIDWEKLFGRGPVTVKETTKERSITVGDMDDPVERRILELEARTVPTPTKTKGEEAADKLIRQIKAKWKK